MTGETLIIRRNTCPSVTSSTMNPSQTNSNQNLLTNVKAIRDVPISQAQAHRILFQFKVGHIHQNWHAPYMPIHLWDSEKFLTLARTVYTVLRYIAVSLEFGIS